MLSPVQITDDDRDISHIKIKKKNHLNFNEKMATKKKIYPIISMF